ncbi:unnamed protein product [Rotaria sp. Silwood2]|nr:unnamed protein product [Rotaria sp. Silwood2]
MDHNKRRTSSIDSYFSIQKKSKFQDIESNDTNIDQTSSISTSSSISFISISDQNIEVVNVNAVENSVENKKICDDISKSHHDSPCQPILINYPTNEDNRSFQDQWYQDRPWLEYSIKNDSAYCYYCRHFGSGSSALTKRKQHDAFVSGGFRNWKRSLEKERGFDKHITSQGHIVASNNYLSYLQRIKTKQTVIDILDSGRAQHIRRNRDRLIKIASLLLLCSRQMIAIRGHNENEDSLNRGNLLEILRWSSQTDPISREILEDTNKNATYLSHQIQNELISIMANQIRTQISEQVKGKFFSLMADESRDISGHEQLSIVIRIVIDLPDTKADLVKEYFMGFIRLHEFDAKSLSLKIVEFLKQYNIKLDSCIAQCYDGVMSGKCAGLQTIMREEYMPKGVYIHCCTHRLNLVIVDVCKVVNYIGEFYSIMSSVYSFFTSSGVANEYFLDAQQKLRLETTKLKLWSDIRWDSRWDSIDALIKNYSAVIQAFDDIIEEQDTRSVNARGLLIAVKEPIFVVTLFVLYKLMGPIKILSNQLKSETIDYGKAHYLISTIIEEIQNCRNERSFKFIYNQILEFSQKYDIDLKQKRGGRVRKIPDRFSNSIITSTIGHRDDDNNHEHRFRTSTFYPLIDSILIELNNRFSNTNLDILKSLAAMYPESEQFLEFKSLYSLADHLNCDLNQLQSELNVIKPMIKDEKLKSIIELYKKLRPYKEAFPTVISMITGALTIPVSSTSCERSFSKMKLIKKSTRNTMNDLRLSDMCLLAVEKDFEIDFEKVIDVFSLNHGNSRILLR